MGSRLKEGNLRAGAAGVVANFTANTRPPLARAQEVTTRTAAMYSRAYVAAEEADGADLIDLAALYAAIELEGAYYSEQVESNRSPARLWLDLLEKRTEAVDARLGAPGESPAAPGGAALAAVWGFGSDCPPRAEGSECAVPPVPCSGDRPSSRRLVW